MIIKQIVMKNVFLFLLAISVLLVYQDICADDTRLKDGVYTGEYSFVKVSVTVKGGKILSIEMIEHGGGGEEYADMVRPLIPAIIKKQSTDVDAVTGATVSSYNLKEAVNDALGKASGE